jgi:hypothetical protein
MTDWGWVTLAHAVVYGTLGTYAVLLTVRLRRARRVLQRR